MVDCQLGRPSEAESLISVAGLADPIAVVEAAALEQLEFDTKYKYNGA